MTHAMTYLTGHLYDSTGWQWAERLHLHFLGKILIAAAIARAEKIQRRNQRIADALHEMGIYHG